MEKNHNTGSATLKLNREKAILKVVYTRTAQTALYLCSAAKDKKGDR
jgi:hypothetical protein